jgi:hypothetical protein
MITIIHGADTSQSRKYFLEQKLKLLDAILFEAEKVTLTDLTQIFEGGGLFSETKNVFIEQFLTKRKKSADFLPIMDYLFKQAANNTITLWEGKELDYGTVMSLKNATMRVFKLPQTLFQLLDALRPGNGRLLISLFHKTIEESEVEMVFFMLIRQVRLLMAITEPGKVEIDELKKMAPWQRSKLQNQANFFQLNELIALFHKLYTIEIGQKTGSLNASLISTIDFFLLEV